jgi:hypothetical protein
MSAPINQITLSGWVARNPVCVSKQRYSFQLVQHPHQVKFHEALSTFDRCLVATVTSADSWIDEVIKQGDHVVVSGRVVPSESGSEDVLRSAPLCIWAASIQRSEFVEQLRYINRTFHNGFDLRFVEDPLIQTLKLT